MHSWLQDHPEAKVGFVERAKYLTPITRESLAFLLLVGAASVDENGLVYVRRATRKQPIQQAVGDVEDCFRKATLVGRWFAQAGTEATAFAMWGVKP